MGTITVSNLGKAYKQYPTRWSRLREWVSLSAQSYHHTKWVLEGIFFTVRPGEAVGIIGVNGAGKSTLLKLITGTTQPTTGSVHITGRVAAMLELGMGFHPDFTGRQNALMSGQLLGYSAEEIARLMPEIESFAEIGEYIDQPLRVYSSGMQMRLAFSVATAIRPDVLIVDEALSVGDAYFQHKSFDRIREFREQGTTLLIVSHDKGTIQSFCDRAILLSAGKLAMEGEPEAVVDYYNAMLADRQNQSVLQERGDDGKTRTTSGTGEVAITDVGLFNVKGQRLDAVIVGERVLLKISAQAAEAVDQLVLGYGIKDRLGQMVFGTNTFHTGSKLNNVAQGAKINYEIEFVANLGPGSYSVVVALTATETHLVRNYQWRDSALVFNVINTSKPEFLGVSWIDHEFSYSVT